MAVTCSNCYFAGNLPSDQFCQNCGAPLQSPPTQSPPPHPQAPPVSSPAPMPQNQLTGRITWLEQSMEQVNFDWYRFLSQLVLFLVTIPLFLAIFTISTALWIGLGILGFGKLAHDLSPFNLVNTVNSFGTLVAIVFPRVPRCNQEPALRMTVQNINGESAALIKGQLISGTFRRGDDVQLQGEWANGTLTVQTGRNRTLNTNIVLRRNYWNIIFWIIVGVLIIGLLFVLRSL